MQTYQNLRLETSDFSDVGKIRAANEAQIVNWALRICQPECKKEIPRLA
jgi:hypothetical protein